MKHLIVDSEGIKLAEMPDSPNAWTDKEEVWQEYESAKKQSIAEAKLFEDQERVMEYVNKVRDLPDGKWEPVHGTYPLPPDFPEYVEVVKCNTIPKCLNPTYPCGCGWSEIILRLVDKQEQRKEESQEGLWDDFWGELIAEGFDTENCKRVQGKYTIKRK